MAESRNPGFPHHFLMGSLLYPSPGSLAPLQDWEPWRARPLPVLLSACLQHCAWHTVGAQRGFVEGVRVIGREEQQRGVEKSWAQEALSTPSTRMQQYSGIGRLSTEYRDLGSNLAPCSSSQAGSLTSLSLSFFPL